MKYSSGRLLFLFFLLVLLLLSGSVLGSAGASSESEGFIMSDITDSRTELSSLQEPLFFDQTELVFDDSTNRFLWSVRSSQFHSSLSPVVRTEEMSDTVLVFTDSLPSLSDLRQSPSVGFMIYDDSQYYLGNVVITTLPIVRIFCDEFIGDEYVKGKIQVWDPDSATLTESETLLKIRGGNTRKFSKNSYRVSLKNSDYSKKNKVSFLNMRNDDDWILYPAYNDQEKVRNVFCSNLWLETCGSKNWKGVRNGSEYKYCELFINNTYWGLYALGNPTDKKEIITDNEEAVLFKKLNWSDEMIAIESSDLAMPGYEINNATGKYAENEDLCWELLREYYQFLRDNRSDSTALLSRIDVENFAHVSIFLNLVQGWDNGANNTGIKNEYLCLTEKDGNIISMMTPWDLDFTFGNGWVEDIDENNTIPYCYTSDTNMPFRHGYLGQILENNDTDLADIIRKDYWALREGSWSDEHINELIDQYEKEIYGSGAFVREVERWPFCTSNNPEGGLSVFRQYVMERLQACDVYYAIP